MTYVIQDFLDYSQMKAGKFRTNLTKFDVCQAVEKVMDIQRHKAKEMQLQFTCKFKNIVKRRKNATIDQYSNIIVAD